MTEKIEEEQVFEKQMIQQEQKSSKSQNKILKVLVLLMVAPMIFAIIRFTLNQGINIYFQVDLNPRISHQNYGLTIIYTFQYPKLPSIQYIEYQERYYEQIYKISKYKKQLPICIMIPSFNNQKNNRYLKNLNSVFRQKYSNYHVIYFDDHSSDKTADLVQKYQRQNIIAKQKMTVIRSEVNIKPIRSQYQNVPKKCLPHQIYIKLDGDDALVGSFTFKIVNSIFQKQDIWFAYSGSVTISNNKISCSRKLSPQFLRSQKYRKSNYWVTCYEKFFYTKLFTEINNKQMQQDDGQYFIPCQDVLTSVHVTQLAGDKVLYFPEIQYLYNDISELSDTLLREQEQVRVAKVIRSRKQYQPLKCLFKNQQDKCIKASEYALQYVNQQK